MGKWEGLAFNPNLAPLNIPQTGLNSALTRSLSLSQLSQDPRQVLSIGSVAVQFKSLTLSIYRSLEETKPSFTMDQQGQPTAAQSRALNEIKRILSRQNADIPSAKALIQRAVGGNSACLEPLRNAVRQKHLSDKQKLDFLLAALPSADETMKRMFGENCFESNSEVYGQFWRITETRSYIRLLLDVTCYAADAEEYQVAVDNSRRVLEMNHGDNNGIRDRVPLFLLHINRPLEALNFCYSWLDPSHEGYDSDRYCPKGGYADLNRYSKESFDPDAPVSTPIQNLGHASLIFSAALACYLAFGDCKLSTSWLREGNKANPHFLDLVLSNPSKWPKSPDPSPRGLGSIPEASDYLFFSAPLWKKDEVREWVRNAADEVAKRECSARDCRKVESKRGEWKVCAGCRGSWYCGKECQEKDWKAGGHKKRCKREREIRELTEKMGKGVNWGK